MSHKGEKEARLKDVVALRRDVIARPKPSELVLTLPTNPHSWEEVCVKTKLEKNTGVWTYVHRMDFFLLLRY